MRPDVARRWLAGAGGALVAAYGVTRRSFAGGLLAAAGGGLVYRALCGRDDLLAIRAQVVRLRPARWQAPDQVTDASVYSFPASDAPAWTPARPSSRRGPR